ncbi:MAG: hypothetical protein EB075_11565 [Bacteroidetes bacterium]|nr:hypothetical protein [Bacteroidota bacterium]
MVSALSPHTANTAKRRQIQQGVPAGTSCRACTGPWASSRASRRPSRPQGPYGGPSGASTPRRPVRPRARPPPRCSFHSPSNRAKKRVNA